MFNRFGVTVDSAINPRVRPFGGGGVLAVADRVCLRFGCSARCLFGLVVAVSTKVAVAAAYHAGRVAAIVRRAHCNVRPPRPPSTSRRQSGAGPAGSSRQRRDGHLHSVRRKFIRSFRPRT